MLLMQRLRGFTDAHKGTYRSIPFDSTSNTRACYLISEPSLLFK